MTVEILNFETCISCGVIKNKDEKKDLGDME